MFRVTRPAIALILALFVAWVGAWSAAHMAPDRATNDRIAATFATGLTEADLCGEPGADHRCPFCHKLPEGDRLIAPALTETVTPCPGPGRAGDLVRGPQHIFPHVSPRAPPRAA